MTAASPLPDLDTSGSIEHPVKQPISAIEIDTIPDVQASFMVGRNGVTRIEATTKSGMHADIPYVRVWKGDICAAEFCQHNIVGVYFDLSDTGKINLSTGVE